MKKWIRMIGMICIVLLILFFCYGTIEDVKREQERKKKKEEITVEKSDGNTETDELYWKLAKDLLSEMITEDEYIELGRGKEGHELYSDEWYEAGNRLSTPYLYVFTGTMYDKNYIAGEESDYPDMTFYGIDAPRRAGEYGGKFIFSVWVKQTERGAEIGTDFSQKLFRHILWECSMEHHKESGSYLIGLFPSEQWMMYCPLYELLGEDMVMVSDTAQEELEEVFQDACERMHEWQKEVNGDLSQNVRFGISFDTQSFKHYQQEKTEEDFEDMRRYQTYYTYCYEQADIASYWKWLERYGAYYPEYRLDFHTGYDSVKETIFHKMCRDRDSYLTWKQEAEQTQGAEETSTEEQTAEGSCYVVQERDSLWKIAETYYGDGRRWRQIYKENSEIIGTDINRIFPGQVLTIP